MVIRKMKSAAMALYLGIAAAGLMASPANATAIINSNTGLIAPATTVDFGANLFPDNTVITNQFIGAGVLFGSNIRYVTTGSVLPAISGGFLTTVDSASGLGNITFTSPVNAAVVSYRSGSAANTTFSAFLSGMLVETFSAATTNDPSQGRFYGFSDILFDEIQVVPGEFGFSPNYDNLMFNVEQVPEPGTLGLFGLGLAGLVLARRRKSVSLIIGAEK